MTRSYVCYLINVETGAKIAKYDNIDDAQREKRRRNEKAGKNLYACKGGWVLNKLQ